MANSVADLPRKKGAWTEAEPLHRQSLATQELVHGLAHPFTLRSPCPTAVLG